MYECPNCGGNLRYDIPSKMMACASCDSKFDPYEVSERNGAQETEDEYEVTVFKCPQCGGEIYSTDNTAAGFCTFCGSAAILESRLRKEHRPKYIIPFRQTKEQCKKSYMKLMGKAVFAPKELKSEKHINEFRGIYMPYWIYNVHEGGGDIRLTGTTEKRRGDYIIKSHYNLNLDLDADYQGIAYDASSSFSDTISENLAPFDTKNMKKFTPAFLSGFYADSADIDTSLYVDDAEQFALDKTQDFISSYPNLRKYDIVETGKTLQWKLNSTVGDAEGAMFPVWFMAYKNKDRVTYATVNGQTGKVVADLPVDVPKYLGASVVLTIPLFFLLNAFLTLIPSTLLGIVCLVAGIVSCMYFRQIDDIVSPAGNHVDCLDLIARNLKLHRFSGVDVPLLNQSVTGNHDEQLPLRVVPVLPLRDARAADIDGHLTAIGGMHQFSKRATVVHVHFQSVLKFVGGQIGQVQGVQLLGKRAIRHLRHQSVTDRVISLLQKTAVFFWNIFTMEPVYLQDIQKKCETFYLPRQEDGRYRQVFHPESELQTKQARHPVLSMIWQSYMERKKIT